MRRTKVIKNSFGVDGFLRVNFCYFLFLNNCVFEQLCAVAYNTASSVIISANPKAKPIVPILLCSPICDSGISSSTMT